MVVSTILGFKIWDCSPLISGVLSGASSELKNALAESIPPQFCTSWQHEIAVAFFSHSDHYFKVNAKKNDSQNLNLHWNFYFDGIECHSHRKTAKFWFRVFNSKTTCCQIIWLLFVNFQEGDHLLHPHSGYLLILKKISFTYLTDY